MGIAALLWWWCFPGLVFGPSLSGNEDSMSITLFKNLVTGNNRHLPTNQPPTQPGREGAGWCWVADGRRRCCLAAWLMLRRADRALRVGRGGREGRGQGTRGSRHQPQGQRTVRARAARCLPACLAGSCCRPGSPHLPPSLAACCDSVVGGCDLRSRYMCNSATMSFLDIVNSVSRQAGSQASGQEEGGGPHWLDWLRETRNQG